jgi:hypothetical protein
MNANCSLIISLLQLLVVSPTTIQAAFSRVGDGVCASASGQYYDYVYYHDTSNADCALYAAHLGKKFTVVGYESISNDIVVFDDSSSYNYCYVLLDNLDATEQDDVEREATFFGYESVSLTGSESFNGSGPIASSMPVKAFAIEDGANVTFTSLGFGQAGDADGYFFDYVAYDVTDDGVCEDLARTIAANLDVVGYEHGPFDCRILLDNGLDESQVLAALPSDEPSFNRTGLDLSMSSIGPAASVVVKTTCYKFDEDTQEGDPLEFELLGQGSCAASSTRVFYDHILYKGIPLGICRSNAEYLANNGIEVVGFDHTTVNECYIYFNDLYINQNTFQGPTPFVRGIPEVNLYGTATGAIESIYKSECFMKDGTDFIKIGDGICNDNSNKIPDFYFYLGTGMEPRCEEAAKFALDNDLPVIGYEEFTIESKSNEYQCAVLLANSHPPPAVVESRILVDDDLELDFLSLDNNEFIGPNITQVEEASCYVVKSENSDGGGGDGGSSASMAHVPLLSIMLLGLAALSL